MRDFPAADSGRRDFSSEVWMAVGSASVPAVSAGDYLRISGVTKRYAGVPVVNDVSFGVARGEVLTILGPSGCGKTTTLKMIAGFLALDSGNISIDGARVDTLSSHDRGAAMVFQNYALFPHMTVRRNVAFGLRMRGLPGNRIAREVDEMLARVRLTEFAERFPKELSGGQQQRVALARALIIKPKILLLDEPFSSLDAKLRKQLRGEFLEVHRTFGITSIFVTHDLEEAFAISDKVAVMNGGLLEQLGSPFEIFSRPRSRFVADFVGHKNLISGEVSAGGMLKSADFEMRVPDSLPPGPILVTVPVHRIRLTPGRAAGDNVRAATVAHVTFLGPAMQIGVEIGATALEIHAPSTAELEGLRPGDRVNVAWDMADVTPIPDGRT